MSKIMNDIKDEFLEDIISNKKEKDINKSNVVTKLMDENNSKYSIDLSKEFPEIPLNLISYRPENEYSIQGIMKLADSIWEIGLLQPLIVYVGSEDPNKKYTLSDGERRFRALQLCQNKAAELKDEKKMKQFETAKCRVLTKAEIGNEEKIHHDANKARINTIFEIIARYKPQTPEVYFGESDENKNRKAYIERKYGKDGWKKYKNDEIKVKWNMTSLIDNIYMIFNEDYPQYLIKFETVKKYVGVILALSTKAIKAINNENYKLEWKKVSEISKLSREEQDEVISKLEDGIDFDEAIQEFRKEKSVKSDEEEDADESISDDKYIVRVGKKLIDEINKSSDKLASIKNKGLNGNQKEYLKQIKKIEKEVRKLAEMPQK